MSTARFNPSVARSPAVTEPAWARRLLIAAALAAMAVLIAAPLAAVFSQALAEGVAGYWRAVSDAETRSAIGLTLLTAAITVPLNTIFGLAAAWLIAKHRFAGRDLLVTLIDLPLGVSPVISGLLFVLLFGRDGVFGAWLAAHDVRVLFAVPGVVMATAFVTFPFVAREVLPLMQSQGSDEEEAALTLGASGFAVFARATLPKIKWGLVYGVILCNARAMGEFGAVSVVSGHIRGRTNTLPLHVEVLYNEYNAAGSFAVASLLTVLAIATLVAKKAIEHRQGASS